MKTFDQLIDVWFNLKWVNALKETFSILMPLLSVIGFIVIGVKWSSINNQWIDSSWLWISTFLPYIYFGLLTKTYSKQFNFQTISSDLLIILSLLINWLVFKHEPTLNLLFIKTGIVLLIIRALAIIDSIIQKVNMKLILPSINHVVRNIAMIFSSIGLILLLSFLIDFILTKWGIPITAFYQLVVTQSSSLIALVLITLLSQYIWYKGFHGFGSVWAMLMCLWLPMIWHQLELFVTGGELQTIMPNAIIWVYAMIGGSGSTFALIIALKLKKGAPHITNDSIKAALFNINESILYGYPLVLNPQTFIPFMLVPVVNVIIAWLLFSYQLIHPAVTILTGVEPIGLNVFILTLGDVRSVLWLLALIILNIILWWPFINKETSN